MGLKAVLKRSTEVCESQQDRIFCQLSNVDVISFRKQLFKSGLNIFLILVCVFTAIRFGPKLWGALQVHGYFHFSQSGCKLISFTEYGELTIAQLSA